MWINSEWRSHLKLPLKKTGAMISTKPDLRGVYTFSSSATGSIPDTSSNIEHDTICRAQAALLKMERKENE